MSRPIGSASALELRRQQAVRAVQAGDKVADVASILGVGKSSLYRWLAQAQEPDGLKAKPHPGSAPCLSLQQQQELETLLRQGAKAQGWTNGLWTTQRIAQVVRRHFGIPFHHDHVGRFLRQKLDWSPQKPKRRARERNEEAIAHWQTVTFPAIVDTAMERDAHVVFLDQSGFMLMPTVRRTWAPQGESPAQHPEIVAETLPGYAPEFNPDEGVWGWTKYGRVANLAAAHTCELREPVMQELSKLRVEPQRLNSFIQDVLLGTAV